jgi:hypothetical protein
MANVGPIKEMDRILGSNFLAIQDALKVLKPRDLELSRYTVSVARDGESLVVLFADNEGKASIRRDFAVRLDTAKELSPSELTALQSRWHQVKVLDRIQGTSLRAIQKAASVFQARVPGLDLGQYRIDVLGEGDSLWVIFADKDRPPDTFGIVPGRPMGFEVQLKASDLSVLQSYFSK